jgi:hypothetical protein
MISTISYYIYKQFNYPTIPTITEEDYNWKQKSIINKMNKQKKKKKAKKG